MRRCECSNAPGSSSSFRASRPAAGRCTSTPATWTRRGRLARRFVEVFDGYEAIVTPSGSCAAHVRTHVPTLVPDDRGVPARTRELSEFLIEQVGAVDLGSSFRGSLAYHPTCHSLRLLRVGDRPLSLLRAVPGVEVVELSGRGGVLRLRRHVRCEERRRVEPPCSTRRSTASSRAAPMQCAPATRRASCTSAAVCAGGARTCGRFISRRCSRRDSG